MLATDRRKRRGVWFVSLVVLVTPYLVTVQALLLSFLDGLLKAWGFIGLF